MQRDHVVVPAHVGRADEYLWHAGAPRRRDHLFALYGISIDADFSPRPTLALEEILRSYAIGAYRRGVDQNTGGVTQDRLLETYEWIDGRNMGPEPHVFHPVRGTE